MASRPNKQSTLGFLQGIFGALKAGVTDEESVIKAIQEGGYYLHEAEVDQMIEKKQLSSADKGKFIDLLENADALKEGEPPAFGERQTRIDSPERASEVASNPEDPDQVQNIQKIMKAIVDLRDKLQPLISEKATLSIALKNKLKK